MRLAALGLALSVATVFSLSTWLEPWFQQWAGSRTKSADLLSVALGDSRRLFARHIYAKADAYFHRGYYPSIFDGLPQSGEMHMAAAAGGEAHHEEVDFHGKPRDWIEAFGRNFYPAEHSHLGQSTDSCCDHDHDHDHEHGKTCQHKHGPECKHDEAVDAGGEQRELLPWLKLAATLDPDTPNTYVVAAYWLRTYLGKVDESEKFLREGLRHNPENPDILFELGRIFKENRNDPSRTRNVWEIGVQSWERTEANKPDHQLLVYAQLLGNLAKLEEEQGNYAAAIQHLTRLSTISPNKAHIEKWIAELREKSPK